MITVVTAVRNAITSIDDCLDSVAAQTLRDVEHLVLDARSTDGTTERIRLRQRPHLTHVCEPDGGIYDALNKGVNLARHDIIGFLHADDTFDNADTLAHLAQIFAACPDVEGIYGDLVYVKATPPHSIVRYWRAGEYRDGAYYRGWMPPHPTLFLRRSVYEKVGPYRTDLRIAADYEFTLRALHLTRIKVAYLPEVITRMRLGGTSNRNLTNILQKTCEDLKAWLLNQHPYPALPAIFLKNLRKLPQFLHRPPPP